MPEETPTEKKNAVELAKEFLRLTNRHAALIVKVQECEAELKANRTAAMAVYETAKPA